MNHNVINEVVKNDLCIGCGICAGICPREILKIRDNKYGEYVPFEIQECNSGCDLCLEICPFSNVENETQIGAKIYGSLERIKYLSETGYYLDSYVGFSNKFRQSSASGGMATWLLTKLLSENIIDYIVCPIPQRNPEKLFSFEILGNEDSIRAASGSVYYPVEMSEVIKEILETPGRYAVTGLPCFIKALRLAVQKNRKLRERILFTIGLVCGQIKSKIYTEYIAALASNGKSGKIQSVYYRGKNSDRPANNFYFQFINEQGSKYKIFWDEGVSEAWVNRWFTPNACSYCDDVFAELADITFMDAWLPEYSKECKGTNLMLVRSPEILALIQGEIEKSEINVSKISIEKVIQSQSEVLKFKRKQLSYRLYLAEKKKQKINEKRVSARKALGLITEREIKLKALMQEESKELFLNYCKNQNVDIVNFKKEMDPYIKQIHRLRLLGKLTLPIRFVKKQKEGKE